MLNNAKIIQPVLQQQQMYFIKNFPHVTYEYCIFVTVWQIQTVNAIFVVN